MARKVLISVLALSLLVETAMTLGGFFAPRLFLSKFGLGTGADALCLVFVLSWTLALVCVVCALALTWVVAGDPHGWTWSFVLGAWWIGIGVGIYLYRGIPDNLVIDSLKGGLIAASAWLSRPKRPA